MYVFLSNGILQEHYLPAETAYTTSIFLFVLLNLPIDSGNTSHYSRPIKSYPKHAHARPFHRHLNITLLSLVTILSALSESGCVYN